MRRNSSVEITFSFWIVLIWKTRQLLTQEKGQNNMKENTIPLGFVSSLSAFRSVKSKQNNVKYMLNI